MTEYFWGTDKSGTEQGAGGIEGLLAVSVDGKFYLPVYDFNGNVTAYVDEEGLLAAQYTYDAFGNVVDSFGEKVGDFAIRFSTKYLDRETGMYYYGRRFYLPRTGRWLNRDPIEEEGGENLYAFCVNNPLMYYDYLGMSFWDDLIDSAKVVVGVCGIASGLAIGAAASWTGIGAAGGAAMVVIGVDQMMEGLNSMYSRMQGGPASDNSPIKDVIRFSSFTITGQKNSSLEQHLCSAYAGVQLTSSCYGGYVTVQSAIQAIRMTYVPEQTVRVLNVQNGFLRYSWRLRGGYWKLKGTSQAGQSAFEITVDGITYGQHDSENDDTGER